MPLSLRFSCLARAVAVLMALALSACVAEPSPQLLNVLDFAPRDAEAGDRLEVIGYGFPEGKLARVMFAGSLHRPGRRAVEGVEIEVAASSTSADRVELLLSDGLQAQFCGAGDEAVHTTFTGDVLVSFAAATAGGLPIRGAVRGVGIDFRPPSVRRAVVEAREREADRALAFMGLTVAADAPPSGGLLVRAVRPGSPADAAAIAEGDIVAAFDGVRVLSKTDVDPSGAGRAVSVAVRRASEGRTREDIRRVEMAGFSGGAPSDLLGALMMLAVAAAIILLFMAPVAGVMSWFERRVAARMQSRIGPNRAGPGGFLVWVADGIKSIMKEDIIPTDSDKLLFRLAPYLVFLGVSATFCVMPFGQHLIAADLDIGILYVVAVTSLVTIGLMMGGWASNNKWSMLGGVRAAAQIVSYEIPGAVAIVCIVMMTGSLRVQDIVAAQGGEPWRWFVFRNPVTFGLFFLWFTTALAEGNRAPFDLPEAESELVAGYSTEYSGMRYLFFFFAEWANVFVMCGIASALFLGGWQIPWIAPADHEASFLLQCAGAVVFQLKSWSLIFVVIWIRWTLPRVRVDQMMDLCWKWFVPASFAAFLLTALWVLWSPLPYIQARIGVAMFAVWVVLVVYFLTRVRYNLRAAHAPVHLNPFL